MIRSLRSLPFFRPPKAILVPGMNFLGFSRYLNCGEVSTCACGCRHCRTYESVLVPGDAGLFVGVGVGVAVGLASLTAEQTVEVRADLVGAAALDGVALSAAGLTCLLACTHDSRCMQQNSPGRACHPWQRHLE